MLKLPSPEESTQPTPSMNVCGVSSATEVAYGEARWETHMGVLGRTRAKAVGVGPCGGDGEEQATERVVGTNSHGD